MRHLWTIIVFYVSALLRGELHFCEECGRYDQCFRYGEQIRRHWLGANKRLAQAGLPQTVDPERFIPEFTGNMLVCIDCSMYLDDKFRAHELCCKPLIEQVYRSHGSEK
jgi:hypothetical protein